VYQVRMRYTPIKLKDKHCLKLFNI